MPIEPEYKQGYADGFRDASPEFSSQIEGLAAALRDRAGLGLSHMDDDPVTVYYANGDSAYAVIPTLVEVALTPEEKAMLENQEFGDAWNEFTQQAWESFVSGYPFI